MLSVGNGLPASVDFVPTITTDGNIVQTATIIKCAYSDWDYKLDITIAVKDITGGPFTDLWFSMPVGFPLPSLYQDTLSVIVLDGSWSGPPAWAYVQNDATLTIKVELANIALASNVVTVTGSIWL